LPRRPYPGLAVPVDIYPSATYTSNKRLDFLEIRDFGILFDFDDLLCNGVLMISEEKLIAEMP